MKFLQESGFGIRLTLLSASVLLAGLLASFLTAKHIKADTDVETKHLLKITCAEIERAIEGRFDLHERILSSAVAFFQTSEGVTRQRWQQFVGYQKFDQHLPGIQGVGFASLVPRDKLEQHIKEIRAEGFPEYTVRPAGERALYSSIIYLEPFSGRNLRAFGYDMLTEPIRLAALERARDLNAPTLSGKVRLVQETAQDVQAGTLMFLPVYQHGMPTETVDQRRSAIRGWIYSPYRMGDLMQGILEKVSPETINRIRVRIFDGDTITPEALLYDSQPDPDNQAAAVASLSAQHRVIISGRPWTLYFTMPYIPHGDRAWLVGVSGGIISLLVTGLILASTLLAARFKGEQMVRRSTQEMLE
ncbi:MAG: CHASE domain-containing protein, partial [Verrucomicrobia bacterium]|nr:CHASE domain-containing protein [Verrucomicrobiota bacterium]